MVILFNLIISSSDSARNKVNNALEGPVIQKSPQKIFKLKKKGNLSVAYMTQVTERVQFNNLKAGFEIRSAQGAQRAHVPFWELSSPK